MAHRTDPIQISSAAQRRELGVNMLIRIEVLAAAISDRVGQTQASPQIHSD